MIRAIKKAVTIPVMAKARIGHFVEAQILEALGVDYIDESEVRRAGRKPHGSFLTPAVAWSAVASRYASQRRSRVIAPLWLHHAALASTSSTEQSRYDLCAA